MLFLIAAFLALSGRCFYLQFLENEHCIEICEKQQQARVIESPQRGVILDCRGNVLAASDKIQNIFADPRDIKDPETAAVSLGRLFGVESLNIYQLITKSKSSRYVKLKSAADEKQCSQAIRIPGVGILSDWQRHYPMGVVASHVIGFVGADNRGLEGIEFKYDKQLKGEPGLNVFLADVSRRPIRFCLQSISENSSLTDGNGLILTIDLTIQQFVHAELLKQYQQYQAESAVAIVAEPKSGAILAMVSLPDYDPENISQTDPNNRRNRSVTDQFEPGSVIKPIVAAIALDTGAITWDEQIFCEDGSYRGKGFGRIGEYGDHKFGNMTVKGIIEKSSNIGMAKIGQKLGKDRLSKGLKLFGFGRKTGVDLPGETEGQLSPVSSWTGYSVTRIPFGQEISITAIQLVRAFCILANGGRAVQPFLVRAIVDDSGRTVKFKQPTPSVGFVVKPEVAKQIVTEAMVAVVNDGTGKKAALEKWQVFGKTGTAQMAKSGERGYADRDYVASFVAGAPAEDPKVIVLVSIIKPNRSLGKGYTGGTVAAPVAGKILEKTLTYLER